MQREITDTTNAMLVRNAELLKSNTIETANEANCGIVDLETLKTVNQNLISTIEETHSNSKSRQRKAAGS